MPGDRSIIYWDSCVFLSYINGIEDRMPILDALLEFSCSDESKIRIHSSALRRVEVAFGAAERAVRNLDSTVERRLDGLWDDPSAVIVVEYHDQIGLMARRLSRDG